MFFFSHQSKVGNCVVAGVFINMMNNFVPAEVPPNVLLHHKAMNHDVPLAIRKRVLRDTSSKISTPGTVSNITPPTWSLLSLNSTIKRAEELRSLPGMRDVNPTMPTGVSRSFPPPSLLFASVRANGLRSFVASLVDRMKLSVTDFASQRNVYVSHSISLPYTVKRYAEIAALRLSQEVMDFGGSE